MCISECKWYVSAVGRQCVYEYAFIVCPCIVLVHSALVSLVMYHAPMNNTAYTTEKGKPKPFADQPTAQANPTPVEASSASQSTTTVDTTHNFDSATPSKQQTEVRTRACVVFVYVVCSYIYPCTTTTHTHAAARWFYYQVHNGQVLDVDLWQKQDNIRCPCACHY
jgi:hypothetical protein